MLFLYIALGLIALVVVAGLVLPSRYAVVRKETIAAPAPAVHAFVGHLDRWPAWMPWEQEDPTVVTTLGDKTTGVGASQSWTSSKSGDGEVEFTACDESTGIAYDMAFVHKDKRAPAKSTILYAPAGEGTEVTWSMEGDLASMMPRFLAGLMRPMMRSMIGKSFTKGLANLKAKVEAPDVERDSAT